MNHCRKCQSDYEKPGTCNCFATPIAVQSADYWRGYADGQRAAQGWTWVQPYPLPQPWWGTITVTGDPPTTTWTATTWADASPSVLGSTAFLTT